MFYNYAVKLSHGLYNVVYVCGCCFLVYTISEAVLFVAVYVCALLTLMLFLLDTVPNKEL